VLKNSSYPSLVASYFAKQKTNVCIGVVAIQWILQHAIY